jgi:hypothetical protein
MNHHLYLVKDSNRILSDPAVFLLHVWLEMMPRNMMEHACNQWVLSKKNNMPRRQTCKSAYHCIVHGNDAEAHR